MKPIEEEAKEYRKQMFPKLDTEWDGLDVHYLDLCFADFAKKKVLQAQIDVLKEHRNNETMYWIDKSIDNLEHQLKELK